MKLKALLEKQIEVRAADHALRPLDLYDLSAFGFVHTADRLRASSRTLHRTGAKPVDRVPDTRAVRSAQANQMNWMHARKFDLSLGLQD